MNLGIWNQIKANRCCAYSRMHVWDGEGTGKISFDSSQVGAPYLGHITENSVIVNALQQKLSEHPQIHFKPTHLVNAERNTKVIIKLDSGESFSSSLLIGADGAQSPLREKFQFSTREWDYGHHAIVTTAETEFSHQDTAWQRFMHTGPLAFLPLPDVNGKHFCSIVWSAEQSLAESLMQMKDFDFCAALENAFESKLGNIISSSKRFMFPLKQRHAKDYIQPQVALVGDAAHTIHPLAGQGANLGFMDAQTLADEIRRAIERKLPLDDFSILRRYQRQRLGHNLGMMTAMESFKFLFSQTSPYWNGLRNFGLHNLDSQTAIKKLIIRQAMGL